MGDQSQPLNFGMFQGHCVLSGDIDVEEETGSRGHHNHLYDKTIEEENEFRSPSMKRSAREAGRRFGGTGRINSHDW